MIQLIRLNQIYQMTTKTGPIDPFSGLFSLIYTFFRMNLADKPARIPSSIDTVGISLHPYFECHRMDIQLTHRACLALETVP